MQIGPPAFKDYTYSTSSLCYKIMYHTVMRDGPCRDSGVARDQDRAGPAEHIWQRQPHLTGEAKRLIFFLPT